MVTSRDRGTGFSLVPYNVVAEEASAHRGMREVGGDPQQCGVKKEEFKGVGRVYRTNYREESRKIRTERWEFGNGGPLFIKTILILTELGVA